MPVQTRNVAMIKIITLLLLSPLALISCSSDMDLDYPVNEQQVIVENYFIGSDEPKVLDALWSDDHIFKVVVAVDGSNQNDYAQYTCQVLHKNGFKDEALRVDVVNIEKPFSSGSWASIGTAKCK
jgi:hypothetical protein